MANQNAFESLTGKIINGLQINGIARRLPELAWETRCTKCGTTGQTHTHKQLKNGSATCKSSSCGKPIQRETSRQAIGAVDGVRVRDVEERRRFEQSQANSPKRASEQPAYLPPECFRRIPSPFDTRGR